MSPPAPPNSSPIDGRRQRAQNNRARIVAAVLDLVHAGVLSPSAEQVATKADVSLRTVFRHFEDMDSLYREISQPIEAELRQIAGRPFRSEDWRERLIELVSRRCEAFERIAPFRRAAEAQRHKSEYLAEASMRFAALLRAIVAQNVPAEVAGSDTFEALDLLLSFPVWDRLSREQGLSPERTRAVLEAAVRKLTS
jgi:AcrR family transcriptional regulator